MSDDEPFPAPPPTTKDPMEQIQQSIHAAQQQGGDLNAGLLFLATASATGQPSVRTLLLRKIVDRRLLILFSKYHGKWRDFQENEQFEVLLWYASIGHQYRIRGHYRLTEADDVRACWDQQPPAIKRVDMSYDREALAPGSPTTTADGFRQQVEALPDEVVASAPPPDHVVAAWLEATHVERIATSPADRLHDRVQYMWADQSWQAQSVIP